MRAKDLWLAHVSVTMLTCGSFVINFVDTSILMSFGLGFLTLGSGYNILVRSLLASLVESHQIGMLYTIIGVLKTVDILIAGPILAICFRTGMNCGEDWIGLPFIMSGTFFASATITISLINLSRLDRIRPVEEEAEEVSE